MLGPQSTGNQKGQSFRSERCESMYVMPRQEDTSQKEVGSNPGGGKGLCLIKISNNVFLLDHHAVEFVH